MFVYFNNTDLMYGLKAIYAFYKQKTLFGMSRVNFEDTF